MLSTDHVLSEGKSAGVFERKVQGSVAARRDRTEERKEFFCFTKATAAAKRKKPPSVPSLFGAPPPRSANQNVHPAIIALIPPDAANSAIELAFALWLSIPSVVLSQYR